MRALTRAEDSGSRWTPIQRKQKSEDQSRKGDATASPEGNDVHTVHRAIGNQAVQKLVRTGSGQPEQWSGFATDRAEHEANRVERRARGVTRPGRSYSPTSRAYGSPGGGAPLDESVLRPMQAFFGSDLSHVRVHTDRRAATATAAMNARAYTVGHQIFFGAGEYAPETRAGLGLLAHELTHVEQQSRGGERVQFDGGHDAVASSFVEEGLNPHDVARRLAASHMTAKDRRPLIRAYYTQYYRSWTGDTPSAEMLARQVEWIDGMVRQRKARQEWERRQQIAQQEERHRQEERRRQFVEYWTSLSPVERYLVVQDELEVGERVDPVRRLHVFMQSCYEIRGTEEIGDEGSDRCITCETTENWIGKKKHRCHHPYDELASFFFRDEKELRRAENDERERIERQMRQSGIPQAEFARRGRQLRAELNLGMIQNALLGTGKGVVKLGVTGYSAASSAKDAYECVHNGDEESCVKSVQSFLSNFTKGLLER